ncbi:Crp/Fnr family transcriptional regulator [Leptospira sarikeiensis]|uniref:Crp/Fnr family transcriptional regulator n=1 Tax=Leptospira sarikeiensis TaxID=2484943 RepID=A0A4R9K715_9LEPT|nr:Crp/Fnr family transcriptional regulator [Leptospira sarikeiensis]TGL62075.1 Crp/Fnr family transcriptional regulator [Leptospira sarikeiensis]
MFEKFRDKIPISDPKWEEYVSCFHRMEVPAKTSLLNEGAISKKGFFVEKGCVRVWFNNRGKDITFQFFFENSSFSSLESYLKEIPSLVSIETVEPCVIWYIHKKDMDRILSEVTEIPELREKVIRAIFERTFNYMRHFLSFIRDTPEERYLNLIKEKPQIIERVPQHYIASYLGISKVHLSRIKSKLSKIKRSK